MAFARSRSTLAVGAAMGPQWNSSRRVELLAALAVSIVLARTAWAAEAESQLAAIEKRLSAAAEKVTPAVVRLSWIKDEHPGSCSGVIVTADGYVATQSCHYLPREKPLRVDLADGRRATGKLLGWCGTLGVGLLKIADAYNSRLGAK